MNKLTFSWNGDIPVSNHRKNIAVFLLIAIWLLPSLAFGQKGKFLLEATSNFSSSVAFYKNDNDKEYRVISLDIQPKAAYFVTDNFSIGLFAGFSFTQDNDLQFDAIDESTISIGPYFRYYLGNDKVRPYILADAGFVRFTSNVFFSLDYDGYGGDAGFGTLVFISKKVALNTQLLYGYYKLSYERGSDMTVHGPQLQFGFSILLGKDEE